MDIEVLTRAASFLSSVALVVALFWSIKTMKLQNKRIEDLERVVYGTHRDES